MLIFILFMSCLKVGIFKIIRRISANYFIDEKFLLPYILIFDHTN